MIALHIDTSTAKAIKDDPARLVASTASQSKPVRLVYTRAPPSVCPPLTLCITCTQAHISVACLIDHVVCECSICAYIVVTCTAHTTEVQRSYKPEVPAGRGAKRVPALAASSGSTNPASSSAAKSFFPLPSFVQADLQPVVEAQRVPPPPLDLSPPPAKKQRVDTSTFETPNTVPYRRLFDVIYISIYVYIYIY